MSSDLLLGVLGVLGTGNILLFAQFLIERHDKKEEKTKKEDMKNNPIGMAVRALCEDRLGILLRDWLHDDVRLADDWRIIESLYEGYKALEGNGEIKKLFKEAEDLKTTE